MHTTRLETRTKESIYSASIVVANHGAERKRRLRGLLCRRGHTAVSMYELEYCGWDPKGSELCPARAKAEETLVEARSRSDVQIDGASRV